MNIFICDDNAAFAQRLAEQITACAAQCATPVKLTVWSAPQHWRTGTLKPCDIAFFDVDLGEDSGIDLARRLRAVRQDSVIVLVSNYVEYAPIGYEVAAFRYLLKPELDSSLPPTFEAALAEFRRLHQTISFSVNGEMIDVPTQDVLYLESDQRMVQLHLRPPLRGSYRFYANLTRLTDTLEPMGFLRIQKSYLVNMEYIDILQYGTVRLTDGTTLSSSEKNHAQIKQRFNAWRAQARWSIV